MSIAAPRTLRRMDRRDLETVLDWAAAEGWNPGQCDADAFFAADPAGFLLAEVDGQPAGSIAAVNYDDQFAVAGLLLVRPEYRGGRVGVQLVRAAWERFGTRTVGLNAVSAKQRCYRKLGFRVACRTIRYECSAGGEIGRAVDSPARFIDLRLVRLADVVAYEERLFPAPRPQFLQAWIHQPGTTALGVLQLDRLVGYGVLRPCRVGYKIGPLFADHESLAEVLLEGLLATAPGSTVYLDVPEPNQAACALARRWAMKPCFATLCMYRGPQPDIDLTRIFALTSLELG